MDLETDLKRWENTEYMDTSENNHNNNRISYNLRKLNNIIVFRQQYCIKIICIEHYPNKYSTKI